MLDHTIRHIVTLLIAAAAIGLAGCNNTLYYGESTSFDLALHVNDNPQTPIEANAGLKRRVLEVAPPLSVDSSDQQHRPLGEAANSFSGFRLKFDPDPVFGPLAIRTQFATGQAAETLADDPQAVAAVVDAQFDYERSADFVTKANIEHRDRFITAINAMDAPAAIAAACSPVKDPKLDADSTLSMPAADCANGTNDELARYVLLRRVQESDPSTYPAWDQKLNIS
jgi:hypothetical protein